MTARATPVHDRRSPSIRPTRSAAWTTRKGKLTTAITAGRARAAPSGHPAPRAARTRSSTNGLPRVSCAATVTAQPATQPASTPRGTPPSRAGAAARATAVPRCPTEARCPATSPPHIVAATTATTPAAARTPSVAPASSPAAWQARTRAHPKAGAAVHTRAAGHHGVTANASPARAAAAVAAATMGASTACGATPYHTTVPTATAVPAPRIHQPQKASVGRRTRTPAETPATTPPTISSATPPGSRTRRLEAIPMGRTPAATSRAARFATQGAGRTRLRCAQAVAAVNVTRAMAGSVSDSPRPTATPAAATSDDSRFGRRRPCTSRSARNTAVAARPVPPAPHSGPRAAAEPPTTRDWTIDTAATSPSRGASSSSDRTAAAPAATIGKGGQPSAAAARIVTTNANPMATMAERSVGSASRQPGRSRVPATVAATATAPHAVCVAVS